MLLRSMQTGIAMSLVGCAGHEETDSNVVHERVQPTGVTKHHFTQLPCNESIIGKEFFVTTHVGGIEREIHVRIRDIFSWEINHEEFTLQTLYAAGNRIQSDEKIKGINCTIEECLQDAVIAPEHEGVQLHTLLGTALISRTEIQKTIRFLSVIPPEFSGNCSVQVEIQAEPNDQGQMLLLGGRVSNWIGLSSTEVSIPDKVGLSFFRDAVHTPSVPTSETPKPVELSRSSNEHMWVSSLIRKLKTIQQK